MYNNFYLYETAYLIFGRSKALHTISVSLIHNRTKHIVVLFHKHAVLSLFVYIDRKWQRERLIWPKMHSELRFDGFIRNNLMALMVLLVWFFFNNRSYKSITWNFNQIEPKFMLNSIQIETKSNQNLSQI